MCCAARPWPPLAHGRTIGVRPGRWPLPWGSERDLEGVKTKVEKEIPAFIEDRDPEILIGISKTLANLGIDSQNDRLYQIMKRHNSPEVRATILKALGDLQFNDIAGAMQLGMKDKEASVRTTALGLIPQLEISKEQLPNVVNPIFRSGSVREQQRMLGVLGGELPIEKSGDVLAGLIADAKNNKLKESVILDLVEAVEATDSEPLIAQLEEIKGDGNSVEAYKETLVGGVTVEMATECSTTTLRPNVRCHAVGGAGGTVGPPLENIGNILTREQILESLIEPSARLAPGYGSVSLTLTDGQEVNGILEAENEHELILRTNQAEPLEVPISRISKRQNMPSAMPAMGKLITKRELRDLIEYLSSLKQQPTS